MPTKMMAPNTALLWIDEAGLTTPEKPKISEITTALGETIGGSDPVARNLSPAVVAGYTLNPTDSDTQDTRSIIDKGVGQSRGYANYEGLIPFFWEDDPTSNTNSEYLEAYDLFIEKGRKGYWIRRVGKAWDDTWTATDVVDVFLFLSWTPRVVTQDNGGAIQFTVPFLPQGLLYTNVVCQA